MKPSDPNRFRRHGRWERLKWRYEQFLVRLAKWDKDTADLPGTWEGLWLSYRWTAIPFLLLSAVYCVGTALLHGPVAQAVSDAATIQILIAFINLLTHFLAFVFPDRFK